MDELISDISGDKFKRVDGTHPIDWRYNDPDNPTKLVLKSKKKPSEINDTYGVQIVVISQSSGAYAIVFVLKDTQCTEIFRSFCEDVIESSRSIDPEEASDFALERYAKWMYLFRPCRSDKMSDENIRGLLGELYCLKDIFIPKFGAASSLRSWMNRQKGKQDFIEHDKWYEVKTLLEGNDTIHISSLEQLSRKDDGELLVVKIKRTSQESSKKITLNTLYNCVSDILPTFSLKRQLSDIVLSSGFVPNDPYYDKFCFEVIDATAYRVEGEFPRLTPDNLPYSGISHVKYEILLDSIRSYEVGKWN